MAETGSVVNVAIAPHLCKGTYIGQACKILDQCFYLTSGRAAEPYLAWPIVDVGRYLL
jgi:hypothetical protein